MLAGTGARVFCPEHAAVCTYDLEQKVQPLLVVENGIKVELLYRIIEGLDVLGTPAMCAPSANLVRNRAATVAHNNLQVGEWGGGGAGEGGEEGGGGGGDEVG